MDSNNHVKNAVKGICAAQKGQNGKTVGYVVTANGMPSSQETVPYLGRTQVGGTCEEDELEDLMLACGCELDKPAIGLVVTATSAYLVNNMHKAPNAFDCGFCRILPVMDGTLPFKDSNFDPERNELHVAVQPSEAIRTALSGSSPRRLGATSPEPSILNVQSLGVRDADTVKADEPFDILGVRVTIGQGDERAEMEFPDKTKVPVTLEVQAGEARQRIVGRFAQPVAACTNARLTLWTRGLRTEGAPLPVSRGGITVLAGETPTGPTVTSIGEHDTFEGGGGNIVVGHNMRFADSDPGGHLVIKDPDGTEVSAMIATDEQEPVTESRFGLSINGDFMAEREYTFEFTMIGADGHAVKVTKKATFVE